MCQRFVEELDDSLADRLVTPVDGLVGIVLVAMAGHRDEHRPTNPRERQFTDEGASIEDALTSHRVQLYVTVPSVVAHEPALCTAASFKPDTQLGTVIRERQRYRINAAVWQPPMKCRAV